MAETESARQSRLMREARAEEDSPTLVGQLRLIREEWGEGFDERIAKPLARVLQTIRKEYDATASAAEAKIEELQDQLEDAQLQAVRVDEAEEELRHVLDDLADVERGVFDVEEIIAKYDRVGVEA